MNDLISIEKKEKHIRIYHQRSHYGMLEEMSFKIFPTPFLSHFTTLIMTNRNYILAKNIIICKDLHQEN